MRQLLQIVATFISSLVSAVRSFFLGIGTGGPGSGSGSGGSGSGSGSGGSGSGSGSGGSGSGSGSGGSGSGSGTGGSGSGSGTGGSGSGSGTGGSGSGSGTGGSGSGSGTGGSGSATQVEKDSVIMSGAFITRGDNLGPIDLFSPSNGGYDSLAVEFPSAIPDSNLVLEFKSPDGTEIQVEFGEFYGEFSDQSKFEDVHVGSFRRDNYSGRGFVFQSYDFENPSLTGHSSGLDYNRWEYPLGVNPQDAVAIRLDQSSTPNHKVFKKTIQWPMLKQRLGWDPTDPTHWVDADIGQALLTGMHFKIASHIVDDELASHDSITVEIWLNGAILGTQTIGINRVPKSLPQFNYQASLQNSEVNIVTGAFHQNVNLFQCIGSDLSMFMKLHYNSHLSRLWRATAPRHDQEELLYYPFGQGWASMYAIRILKEAYYKRDSNLQPEKVEILHFQDADGSQLIVRDGFALGQYGHNYTFGVLNEYIIFNELPNGNYSIESIYSPLTITFDNEGKLIELRHKNHGRTLNLQYQGNEVRISDPQGRETIFEINNDRVTKITDPQGRDWILHYDLMNLIAISSSNSQYFFEYYDNYQLKKITGDYGFETFITYSSQGRKVKTVDDGNSYREFEYLGQEVKLKDSVGNEEVHEYSGNAWRITSGNESNLRYERDTFYKHEVIFANPIAFLPASDNIRYERLYPTIPTSHQITLTYPNGITEKIDLENSGFWVLGHEDEQGKRTDYVPIDKTHAVGLIKEIHEPQIGISPRKTTVFDHNEYGEIKEIKYPNGKLLLITLSANSGTLGMIEGVKYKIEGKEFTESFEYNNLGYLKAHTNRFGGKTVYTYSSDKLVKIEHPDQSITNFIYDNLNRIERIEYPDQVKVEYTYDSNLKMLVKTITETNVGTTEFVRNGSGELTQINNPAGFTTEVRSYIDHAPFYTFDSLIPFWIRLNGQVILFDNIKMPPAFTNFLHDVSYKGIPRVGDFKHFF